MLNFLETATSAAVVDPYKALLFLGVIIIVGSIFGRLIEKIDLPSVTGYIVAGLILGPVLGLFSPGYQTFVHGCEQYLTIISNVAIGFIAFSIGTEFWLPKFKKSGKRIMLITLCEPIMAFIFVTLLVHFVGGKPLWLAMTLGSIATATAPAPTLMIVKRYKAKGEVTDTMIPVIGLDDAVGTIIFSVVIAIVTAMVTPNASFNATSGILAPVLEIIASGIAGAIIGTVLGFATKYVFCKYDDNDKQQSFLGIILVVVFVSIVASNLTIPLDKLGIDLKFSSILVPMTAGFVFTNMINKTNYRLQNRAADNFTGPLMVAFFTLAGANLQLASVGIAIVPALLYVLGRATGKMGGGYLGAVLGGSSKKVRNHVGFTLLPQGGVEIGLVLTAANVLRKATGNFDYGNQVTTIIIIGIFIFELIGPVVTKATLEHAQELHYKDAVGEEYHF